MTNKTITFLPQTICRIEGEPSILEVALKNKVPLSHSCGGMGSCTTCRVIVEKGLDQLPPRTEVEQEMADMRGFAPEERLGCQTPAIAGLVVRIPES